MQRPSDIRNVLLRAVLFGVRGGGGDTTVEMQPAPAAPAPPPPTAAQNAATEAYTRTLDNQLKIEEQNQKFQQDIQKNMEAAFGKPYAQIISDQAFSSSALANSMQKLQQQAINNAAASDAAYQEASGGRTATQDQAALSAASAKYNMAAFNGTLPIDPGTQQELARQETELRASLQNQIGPGYESSTTGQYALQQFTQRKEALLAAIRSGRVNQAQAYSQGYGGAIGAAGNALGQAGGAMNPFQTTMPFAYIQPLAPPGSAGPLMQAGQFQQNMANQNQMAGYGAQVGENVQGNQLAAQGAAAGAANTTALYAAGIGALGSVVGGAAKAAMAA